MEDLRRAGDFLRVGAVAGAMAAGYFGTYRGVRGFSDTHNRKAFAQSYPGTAGVPYGGKLLPFRFDTSHQGECVNDIDHGWGPQHRSWNNGAMDSFLSVHLDTNGARDGTNTMGTASGTTSRSSTPSPTRSRSATATTAP